MHYGALHNTNIMDGYMFPWLLLPLFIALNASLIVIVAEHLTAKAKSVASDANVGASARVYAKSA